MSRREDTAAKRAWRRRTGRQNPRRGTPAYIRRLARNRAARSAIVAAEEPEGCERCGDDQSALQRHHPDYRQPLDVEFLCPICHQLADREQQRKAS